MKKREVYFPEKPTKPPTGPAPETPPAELSERILYLPNPYKEGELDECIEQAKQLEAENEALRELFWMTLYYWMGPEFGPMPTDEEMYNKIAETHALLTGGE
jgi:hypothetical protein